MIVHTVHTVSTTFDHHHNSIVTLFWVKAEVKATKKWVYIPKKKYQL